MPIVLVCAIGTVVSRVWFGDYPAFVLVPQPVARFVEYRAFMLLGVVSAAAPIRGVFLMQDLFGRWGPCPSLPAWAWLGIDGFGTRLLALAYPHVLGVSYEGADLALQGALPLGGRWGCPRVGSWSFCASWLPLAPAVPFAGGHGTPPLSRPAVSA